MKLNALLKTLGFLALAATPVVAGTAPAPKNPAPVQPVNDDLGVNIGLGYHTNAVWRGANLGQHWIDGSLGGAIPLVEGTRLAWDVNYGSLAGDQDHLALAGARDMSWQRLQLGAAIQQDLGPVTLSAGYRYFRNMGDFNTVGNMNDGQEVSLGLATALGPINVASSANYDFVNDSWYFDLDLNTNIAVTDSISIVPFFNVGYGKNFNWQFNKSNALIPGGNFGGNGITGWTAISTGLRFPIKLNSRATLTPYIAGNLPLGTTSDLIAGPAVNDTPFKSVLMGGVTLSVRF
jgi:hypothetical protein